VVLCDCAVNGDRIYQGVHVGTVDVSGMTVDEASTAIAEEYNPIVRSAEVNIYADEATRTMAANGAALENLQESENVSADEAAQQRKFWTVNAEEIEAHVDAEGLAQLAYKAGREEGGITARMSAQTFGWQIEPTVIMNDAAVESLASSIDRAIGDVHVDFDVAVEDGYASVTEGHPGREVDPATLESQIGEQFLGTSDEHGIVAVTVDTPVNIDRDSAQAVADQINEGIAQGATFNFEGTTWQATPEDLGSLIVTNADKNAEGAWQLIPSYDEYAAKSAILANLQSTYSKQNIKVEFVDEGGEIKVKTDASGTMPEVGEALVALQSQTLGSKPTSSPVITVTGSQIPSTMTIESAMHYGIITKISSYETE
jgi:predicted ABC-type ATPase